MSDLHLVATQSTPAIAANRATGIVEMRGDSYPENTFEFFTPLIGWIDDFLKTSTVPLRLDLYLLYLNTSSVKAMMDIFDMLEEAHGKSRDVAVCWFYDHENERIAELAAEFKEDCTFPFEILSSES